MNSRTLLFSRFRASVALMTLAAGAWTLQADVKPHALFSDHMVLQRGKQVPVWGRADDGEKVQVTFRGHTVTTTAQGGKWSVVLPPQRVGGPEKLVIKGNQNEVVIDDVLVGEVWVASGQSNMEWPFQASFQAQSDIESATNSQIRLFTVPKKKSTEPETGINSSWKTCTPENAKGFSAVAYYFGRDLQAALKVPVGLIHSSWGGSPAEAWMSSDILYSRPEYKTEILDVYNATWENYRKAAAAYQEKKAAMEKEGKKLTDKPPQEPWFKPIELYNGMIAPLIPYAIQGAIWYQGESNAGKAHQYRTLFQDMIRNWRRDWKQGDFPFLVVQLAPFDPRNSLEKITSEPAESAWAELREAQNLAAKQLSNVGVAVITDVGEKEDIHPKKKEPVGHRLSLLARKIAYGEKRLVASGPEYKSMKVEGNKIILTFDNAGGGLVARDGDLKGFAIAGSDHKFVFASAKIVGKNQVEVTSPQVTSPVAVRYGWADYPVVNLWNREGLPASPFRTDDFPMITKK